MSGDELVAQLRARVGTLEVDVSLALAPGPLVLVGPNGAGKSTLLALLLGVLPVRTGRITVGATPLLDTDRKLCVPVELRRLAYVPQNYALFPHLDVRANVAFALASASPGLSRREARARVNTALAGLELLALAHRSPQTLSGGEQQRVALARALCVHPRALLLDEPLAALDVSSRQAVRNHLRDHLQALALPSLLVTHDARDAHALGARIAVMEAGRISQIGEWDELCERPATAFVRAFTASGRD